MKTILISALLMTMANSAFALSLECRGVSEPTKERVLVQIDLEKPAMRVTHFYTPHESTDGGWNYVSSGYGSFTMHKLQITETSDKTVIRLGKGFTFTISNDFTAKMSAKPGWGTSVVTTTDLTCEEKEFNEEKREKE